MNTTVSIPSQIVRPMLACLILLSNGCFTAAGIGIGAVSDSKAGQVKADPVAYETLDIGQRIRIAFIDDSVIEGVFLAIVTYQAAKGFGEAFR